MDFAYMGFGEIFAHAQDRHAIHTSGRHAIGKDGMEATQKKYTEEKDFWTQLYNNIRMVYSKYI